MSGNKLVFAIKVLGAMIPLGLLFVSEKFLFPFVTPKAFIFRVAVELMCFFYIWLLIKDRDYLPKKSLLSAAVIGYFFVQVISGFFGADWYRSWWGNFERMDGLLTQLHYALYFLIISSVWRKRDDWNYFLISSSVVGFVLLLIGVAQRFGVNIYHFDGSARVTGSFGNAAYFASYIIVNIFFALALLCNQKKWNWKKYFFLFYFLLGASVLLFTGTRGAFIGLAVGLTLFFILFNLIGGQKSKWRFFAPIVVLLLLACSVFVFRDNAFLNKISWFNRLTTISISAVTAQSRLFVWNIAFLGWEQKPLLGWGWGQFETVFNHNYNPALYNQEPWFDHAHNVYLEILATTGVFGLLFYILLPGCAVFYLWRARRRGKISAVIFAAACGFLSAYLLQNAFIFDMVTGYIYFYSFLAFAFVIYFEKDAPRGDKYKEELSRVGWIGKSIIIASFLFLAWIVNYINILPIKANYYATDALHYSAADEWSGIYLEKTSQALSYKTFGNQEIKYHLLLNHLKNILDKPLEQVDRSAVLKFTVLAESEFKKSIKQEPVVLRSYVALAYVYLMNAKLNPGETKEWSAKALAVIKDGKNLSPNKQDLLFLESQAYLGLDQFDEAMNVLDYAISLNKSFTDPFTNYLKVATFASANDKIFDVLKDLDESGLKFLIEDWEDLLNLAVNNKNFPIIIEYYKRLVALDYNYARYHSGLAAAYAEIGDYNHAREEALITMNLDPNFAANGKLFIDGLKNKQKN